MKRMKRHKIKKEKQDCSSQQEEHDLAYYIHDRVELMHQVFSMLKYKELKTMAPECVRNLAIGDLQELCTEELLGISSKRLLAILDGAEPPSDTESSSPSPPPDHLETISLDSISSDEELLASSNKKKKHKHRRHSTKSKSKKKDKPKEPDTQPDENAELSKASRAGLTVLELLELQARARAIRAQLQQEQASKLPSEMTAVDSSHHSSDNEVEIKEEPPDVVEISSEDEKPDVNQLQKNIAEVDKTTTSNEFEAETEKVQGTDTQSISRTFTKRINDLIITVPQAKPTRKIKLNRRMNNVNVVVSVPNNSEPAPVETRSVTIVTNAVAEKLSDNSNNMPEKLNESKAKKKKRDKKKKTVEKDGSDHDEITLQLSDSEKMDLFEDLDDSRKNYDKVSSSSEDSESSSSDSDHEHSSKDTSAEIPHSFVQGESSSEKIVEEKDKNSFTNVTIGSTLSQTESSTNIFEDKDTNLRNYFEDTSAILPHLQIENESSSPKKVTEKADLDEKYLAINESKENTIIKEQRNCKDKNENAGQNIIDDFRRENDAVNGSAEVSEAIVSEKSNEDQNNAGMLVNETKYPALHQNTCTTYNETSCDKVVELFSDKALSLLDKSDLTSKPVSTEEKFIEISSIEDIPVISNSSTKDTESQKDSDKDKELIKESEKDLSDGELTDRQSSEVEAMDLQPEIVCISDEETPKNIIGKKKKKKDKKSKKEKRSKKNKSDFREDGDQNFYKDAKKVEEDKKQENDTLSPTKQITKCNEKPIDLNSDEVYEILELSDDSSCYEVEGTVLSKEPTAEEIEALSAKIDEIEREEVVTDEQIRVHEQLMAEKGSSEQSDQNIDCISWKDRYLGSKKVKKVLTTANIFNALRKKNKELKKKIEDSKKKDAMETTTKEYDPNEINVPLEEGSIQQYNALQGLTKYVNPVEEPNEKKEDAPDNNEELEKIVTKGSEEENVTKEMKKDAKQLLKMYKRLLKHNNMQKDRNRKKKKKQKKKAKEDSQNNDKIADST